MCLAAPAFSVTPVGILPPEERGGEWDAFPVAGIADLDGDEAGEIVLGDTAWNDHVGRVLLYSGGTLERIRTFDSPTSRSEGCFGSRIAVGDLEQDGQTELIVTALREGDPAGGRLHVFSLKSGQHLRMIDSPQGIPDGNFGNTLDILDDVNGDGTRDLLVGAVHEPAGTLQHAGRVYVISGAEQATVIHTSISPHPVREGLFGSAVAATPDLDNDGIGDFFVGAPWETSASGIPMAGRVYLFSGATGTLIREIETSYSDTESNQEFGASVDVLGPDQQGRLRLVIGRPGYLHGQGDVLVSDLRSSESMPGVYSGWTWPIQHYGYAKGLGDLTGDGIEDFGIGALGVETEGRILLFNGQDHEFWAQPPFGGGYFYRAYPMLYELFPSVAESGRLFGFHFSAVPDLNGDGSSDFLASGDGQAWLYRSEAHAWAPSHVSYGTVLPRSGIFTRSFSVSHDNRNGFFGILRFYGPGFEILGNDAQIFAFESLPSTEPLLIADTREVRIRFAPQTSGQKTATLKIYTNDPDNPVLNVALSGLAVSIQVSTTTLQFEPRSPFQEASPPRTFTITNHGDTPLGFVYPCMEMIGEEDSEFFLDPEPNFYPIPARESRSFSVRFRPLNNGPRQARLLIHTTDPFQPEHAIDLQGGGLYIPEHAIYVPSYGTLLVVDPRTGNRGISMRADWGLGPSSHGIQGVQILVRERLVVGGMTRVPHSSAGFNYLTHVEKMSGNRLLLGPVEPWPSTNLYPPILDRESSGSLVVLRQQGIQRIDPETGVGYTLIPVDALEVPFPGVWPDTYTALAAEAQGTILLAGYGIRRFDPYTSGAEDLCSSPIFSLDLEPDGSIVAPIARDDEPGCVVRIDPETGDLAIVSGSGIGEGPGLIHPYAIAVDPTDGSLLVTDTGLASLLRIDSKTGDRTLVSGPDRGTGPPLPDSSIWPDCDRQIAVEPDWSFPLWGARYWILR